LLALAVGYSGIDAAPFSASPSVALPGDEIVISGDLIQANADVLLWGDPAIVGSLNLPGYSSDIVVSGDYAFIASGDAGLHVVDITDINQPTLVANLPLAGNAIQLTQSGNYLLIATEASGMQIVDVSNPITPVLVSEFLQASIATGVSETNSYAYTGNYTKKVAAAADLESLVLKVGLHDRALGRSGTDLHIAHGPGPLILGEVVSGTLIVPSTTYTVENDFGQIGGSLRFPGGMQDGPIIVGSRDDLKPTLNLNDSAAVISVWVSNIDAPASGGIVSAGPNAPNATNRGGWTIFMNETGRIFFIIARRNSPSGSNCSRQSIWGSAKAITDGERHHIVAVYDPARDEFYTYIDGLKGGVQTLNGCRADSEGDDSGTADGVDRDWFSLGEIATGGSGGRWFFNGTVEDLSVLKPAAIPPEIDAVIREWYTLGAPGPLGAGFF
jgi:hypothetical protein